MEGEAVHDDLRSVIWTFVIGVVVPIGRAFTIVMGGRASVIVGASTSPFWIDVAVYVAIWVVGGDASAFSVVALGTPAPLAIFVVVDSG